MKLCWSCGPIEPNAYPDRPDGRWALRDSDGIDISDAYPYICYVDDESGEIWHFTLDDKCDTFIDSVTRVPAITKTVLGPGAFRLEWFPPGTMPLLKHLFETNVSDY